MWIFFGMSHRNIYMTILWAWKLALSFFWAGCVFSGDHSLCFWPPKHDDCACIWNEILWLNCCLQFWQAYFTIACRLAIWYAMLAGLLSWYPQSQRLNRRIWLVDAWAARLWISVPSASHRLQCHIWLKEIDCFLLWEWLFPYLPSYSSSQITVLWLISVSCIELLFSSGGIRLSVL